MTHRRTHPTNASATIALTLLAWGAASHAQPEAPPADLSGPKVQDRDVPGVPSRFGQEIDPRRRATRTPHEVFMRAIRSLTEDPTPPEARLTPDQQAQIQAIADEQQRLNREFMLRNMEELRSLRERTGQRAAPGAAPAQRPAAGAPLSDEERATLVARLQELESARPSADAAHTQIYAVLTPAQQDLFRAEIDRWSDQQIEQRAMQRLEALKAQRPAEARPPSGKPGERMLPDDQSAAAGAAGVARTLGIDPTKLEKIRERLAAPPTDAEKGSPHLQRLAARIDALPADLATPEQKDKLRAFLLEKADPRAGRR